MTTTPDFEAQAREIAFDIMSVGWREEGKPKDIIFYDDEIEPKLFTAISSALLRAFELGCQATSTAACEPSSSLRSSSSENGGEASKGKVDFSFIILNILRGYGWSVAVHNDYRMNGKFHTFWLLTHANGRWVKGEGESDEIALTRALSQIEEAGTADEVSAANTSASLTPHQEEA